MYDDISNLKIWSDSHNLVLNIYKITDKFPKIEDYGLKQQIRRAAVSIPSNISEGRGRTSKKEFKQFLSIARGSLEEVKYQLLLSKDLEYITIDEYSKIFEECTILGKMLNNFIKSIIVV